MSESQESETRLSQLASYSDLFFRMQDSVLLVDPEQYRILDLNDSAEKLFASDLSALQGMAFLDRVALGDRELFEKTLRITRRRYHPREWESVLEFQNQEIRKIPVRVTACVLKLQDGREAIQILIRDVTQEKQDQEKIRQTIAELEVLNHKLAALSTTDEMTGLANFRHFKSQLQAEHARAQRYAGTYSLVFFDVDHFKHYNDHNGHPAGDELLRALAKIFKGSCRDTDLPARYGGEEFVALCPEVGWKNAMVLAERVREAVATKNLPFGEYQPLGIMSVSVGVASYPEDGKTSEDILKAADEALYSSKKNGRNRTTAFSTLSPQDKNSNPI